MKYLQEFLNLNPSTPKNQMVEQEDATKNLQNLQKPTEHLKNETSIGSVGFPQCEEEEDIPPALQERPGMDLVEPGLWVWRGFIVPTPATMPAYKKHCNRQIELRRRREQDSSPPDSP